MKIFASILCCLLKLGVSSSYGSLKYNSGVNTGLNNAVNTGSYMHDKSYAIRQRTGYGSGIESKHSQRVYSAIVNKYSGHHGSSNLQHIKSAKHGGCVNYHGSSNKSPMHGSANYHGSLKHGRSASYHGSSNKSPVHGGSADYRGSAKHGGSANYRGSSNKSPMHGSADYRGSAKHGGSANYHGSSNKSPMHGSAKHGGSVNYHGSAKYHESSNGNPSPKYSGNYGGSSKHGGSTSITPRAFSPTISPTEAIPETFEPPQPTQFPTKSIFINFPTSENINTVTDNLHDVPDIPVTFEVEQGGNGWATYPKSSEQIVRSAVSSFTGINEKYITNIKSLLLLLLLSEEAFLPIISSCIF